MFFLLYLRANGRAGARWYSRFFSLFLTGWSLTNGCFLCWILLKKASNEGGNSTALKRLANLLTLSIWLVSMERAFIFIFMFIFTLLEDEKKMIIATKNELKILLDTYLLLLLLLLEFCCTLLIKDTAKLSKAIRKVNTKNIFHTKNCFTLTAMGVSGSPQLDLMDLEWIKRFSSEISIKSKWIWVTFTGGQIELFVIIAVESILLRCWLLVAVFSSKNCTSRWIAYVPLKKL